MSRAAAWLQAHAADAPPELRARMLAAVPDQDSTAMALAEAARACLARVLRDPDGADAALDLLAADALLTHACAAAAEQGDDALIGFADTFDADYFQQLLEQYA